MRNLVLKFLLSLSSRLRRKRLRLLVDRCCIGSDTRILDVGGSSDWDWGELGIHPTITHLNMYSPEEVNLPNYVQGDARNMHMFADGEFDLVISNGVIEHLLSRKDQDSMAREIQRVGKSYWVQTPNKHFPLELHLCFPFIQYWPVKWRIAFAQIWPFSFEKMRGHHEGAVADAQVILLSKRQFHNLFPGSELICEKLLGFSKSLIVFKGR